MSEMEKIFASGLRSQNCGGVSMVRCVTMGLHPSRAESMVCEDSLMERTLRSSSLFVSSVAQPGGRLLGDAISCQPGKLYLGVSYGRC